MGNLKFMKKTLLLGVKDRIGNMFCLHPPKKMMLKEIEQLNYIKFDVDEHRDGPITWGDTVIKFECSCRKIKEYPVYWCP